MSQISSAYPTAGGLYHWGSILGNRGTGWVTAWLNLLGLITVLGAINVGTWTFFMGAFGPTLRHREQPDHADDLPDHHHRRPGADQPHGHQAHRQAYRLLRLSDLRRRDPDRRSSALPRPTPGTSAGCSPSPTIPARPAAMSGRRFRTAWVFALGLLLPIYTITGYDASAHTSEETIKAAHSVPRAMVDVGRLVGALRLSVPGGVRADDPQHGRGRRAGLERVLLGLRPTGQLRTSRRSSISSSSSRSCCAVWRR